jgi:hypothetical protein
VLKAPPPTGDADAAERLPIAMQKAIAMPKIIFRIDFSPFFSVH